MNQKKSELTIKEKVNSKIYGAGRKLFITLMFVLTLLPAAPALAQTSVSGGSICDNSVNDIADVMLLGVCIIRKALIPLLITLSITLFIVGVVKYIANGDEAAQREEGRKYMIYGIIALFVMVSIWGLVGIIQGTFGVGTSVLIPQLEGI